MVLLKANFDIRNYIKFIHTKNVFCVVPATCGVLYKLENCTAELYNFLQGRIIKLL